MSASTISSLNTPFPGFISSGIISNWFFTINGVLTVDDNLEFRQCQIELGPNAIINILPGFTLKISSASHLQSCNNGTGDMWQGIEVRGTYTPNLRGILIIGDQSIVEDAVNAVHISPGEGGEFKLDHAIFNRNREHIFVEYISASGGGGGVYYQGNSWIRNCEFTCNDPNGNPGLVLNNPFAGQRTAIAVHLDHVEGQFNTTPFVIGGTGFGNIMHNSDVQIWSHHSRTQSEENDLDVQTTGIYATFDGELYVYGNTIYNSDLYGIEAEDFIYLIDLTSNTIKSSLHGIFIHDASSTSCHISQNNISETRSIGIHLNNNFLNHPSICQVDSNALSNSINNPGITGIFIGELQNTTLSTFTITGNTVDQFYNGIAAINLYDPLVNQNTVTLKTSIQSGVPAVGIYTLTCAGGTIHQNTVTSDPANACCLDCFGIVNEESPFQYLVYGKPFYTTCNFVEHVSRGFVFQGLTEYNVFAENEMGDCKDQFYLDNNALGLGDQPCSTCGEYNNVWLAQYNSCDPHNTYGENSNLLPNPTTNFFYYYSYPTPYHPSNNQMAGFGNPTTFTATTWLNNFSWCNIPPHGGGGDGERMTYMQKVAGDSIDFKALPNEEWLAKFTVCNTLLQDSSLKDSSAILHQFYDTLSLQPIGQISQLIKQVWTGIGNNSLAGLQSALNLFNPTNLYESNLKWVMSIQLQISQNGYPGLSAKQKNDLINLAESCFLVNGPAVSTALVLLASMDSIRRFPKSDCYYQKLTPRIQDNAEEKLAVDLYPLPAGYSVTLSFNQVIQDRIVYRLTDVLGTAKQTSGGVLQSDIFRIDLSEIPSGFYNLELWIGDSRKLNKKLVIVK